ncbi:MAG: transposase, partial [Clostridia bacterium]|nr:transposase [Clostridia bacterium]
MITRKPNRLKGYDYSADGAYFITLCTQNHQPILSALVGDDAHIVPTTRGKIAEKYLRSMPGIDRYVMMP